MVQWYKFCLGNLFSFDLVINELYELQMLRYSTKEHLLDHKFPKFSFVYLFTAQECDLWFHPSHSHYTTSRKVVSTTRDVCKTLTSRPLWMKHLPRSSPHLVHDETKSFESTPSPHPVHDETKSFGSTPHPLDATAKIYNGNLYQINNFNVKTKL